MRITHDTALIAIGGAHGIAPDHSSGFLDRWVLSGRGIFFIDWEIPNLPSFPAGSHGYAIFITSSVEDVFSSTSLPFELTRRSCKNLLFYGLDLEGRIETNIRSASSRGYNCYLYNDEKSNLEEFWKRSSRYSESMKMGEILRDIEWRI